VWGAGCGLQGAECGLQGVGCRECGVYQHAEVLLGGARGRTTFHALGHVHLAVAERLRVAESQPRL